MPLQINGSGIKKVPIVINNITKPFGVSSCVNYSIGGGTRIRPSCVKNIFQ